MPEKQPAAARPWKGYMLETLKDPHAVQEYLEAAVEAYEQDSDRQAFLLALRMVAEAQGGISELARKSALSRQHLYRALSENGNPTFETLTAVFKALGLRFTLERAAQGAAPG